MNKEELLKELNFQLKENLTEKWYPLVVDKKFGGYYSDISNDWKPFGEQNKMLVTQSRHIWTTSKLSSFYNSEFYKNIAEHGFNFLKDCFWDNEFGGFYLMRSREGKKSDYLNFADEKRTYPNAFAIYGLAALYKLNKNDEVLDLAKKTFNWLEEKAFDKKRNGYYQFLTREGAVFDKDSSYKSKADDIPELGFKDQNSSIHLMEAYTGLLHSWDNEQLRNQLENLLLLIRDKFTTSRGTLNLFFDYELNPFKYDKSKEEIIKDHRLDHVSFGHDYETGFLMLEASYTLGLKNDLKTLLASKKMLDHAIENGWDKEKGGFYEAGYYFNDKCEIIQPTKNWWAQAEGLNALLLMSQIFPKEKRYYELFLELWQFVNEFVIDNKNGGWFWGSLDKQPEHRTTPKGTIWKGTYHTGRALINCINILSENSDEMNSFIKHWRQIAEMN